MKKGVILLNMGGPNNLDEVEVFLKNMFNDKNIITTKSSILRSFIAFMITFFRKNQAKKNYEQIGGFSPIVKHTQSLINLLNKKKPDILFDFAMAYTPPFVSSKILNFANCDELVVFPLYPHYSTTTIKTSIEDFNLHANKINAKITYIKEFYKNELYNEIIIKLISQALKNHNACEFELVFSAHSLPQKIINNGDVYEKQINEHVKILSELLVQKNINFSNIHLAYQSKLGPVKWLEPELKSCLQNIKTKKVIIFPIAFCIDNSETDYELSIEYKHEAKQLGFSEYIVAKCPNDLDEFAQMIIDLSL